MQEFAVVAIALLTLFMRTVVGTWFHPSVIYGAAWFTFLVIPTALGRLAGAPTASLVVLGSVAAATLSTASHVRPSEMTKSTVESSQRLRRFVVLSGLAGAAAGLVTQAANGIGLSTIWNLDALNAAAIKVTQLRYGGDIHTPIAATLLLAVAFAGAVAAPYAAASAGRWPRVLMLAPAAGCGFYALSTTAKAPFVIAVALTAGAWSVVHSVTAGGRPRMNPRIVRRAVLCVAVVVGAFVYLTASRLGGWTPGNRATIADKVSIYAGGGIPAYDAWLTNGGVERHWFGAQTFAGVAQFLLFDPNIGAAYREVTPVGAGQATNVYTVLRPLTEDFGVAGALAFLAAGCLFAALAYRRAVISRSVGASLVVAGWLGFVLFSSATSVYSFANVCLGVTVGAWAVSRTTVFQPASLEPRPAPAATGRSPRSAPRPARTGRRSARG